jgi:adenylate kinase
MIVVLFGKPGAGKGTQAPLLAAALGVPTLATGDELRSAISAGTQLGLEAKGYMDRGDLVPDSVILAIIKQALSTPKYARGVLFDGVVRTVPQAEGLSQVLCFDIDDDEIVHRLASRTVCEKCQTPYAGREAGSSCDKNDGGKLVRRKDDDPAAIRNRLEVYERQTAPVLAWYRLHGTPVVTINAVGTVDEVRDRALAALQA